MDLKSTARCGAALVFAGGLTSCGIFGPDPAVAQKWSNAIAQYQVHPVFPPREDVQVGDLILTCTPGLESKPDMLPPIPVLLLRLPVKESLLAFYQQSITPPENPIASDAKATSANGKEASNPLLFDTSPSPTNRLRSVAFPDSLSVQLSSATAQALFPAGVTLGTLHLGSTSINAGSISIPSAVSYQLDQISLMTLLNHYLRTQNTDTHAPSPIKEIMRESAGYDQSVCRPRKGNAQIVLVREVFLANIIRVQLQTSNTFSSAGKDSLDPDPNSTVAHTLADILKQWAQEKVLASAPPAAQPDKAATAPGQPASSTAIQTDIPTLISNIKTTWANLFNDQTSLSLPGVVAKYSVSRSGDISMDRQFLHPVVVGYRGIELGFTNEQDYPLEPATLKETSAPAASMPVATTNHMQVIKGSRLAGSVPRPAPEYEPVPASVASPTPMLVRPKLVPVEASAAENPATSDTVTAPYPAVAQPGYTAVTNHPPSGVAPAADNAVNW